MTAGLRARGLRHAHAGPFDLDLPPGACLAITGPSGSGKSLLLRMVADLDPHEGEAWLDGVGRGAMSGPDWRRRVAYAPAEPGWWLDRIGGHFLAPSPDAARLGLSPDIWDRAVTACSTGERARLALLRALAANPAVLLLDEPTGALDHDATLAVEALLAERMRAGLGLVLVTHDATQAERLGTARRRMAGGQLT